MHLGDDWVDAKRQRWEGGGLVPEGMLTSDIGHPRHYEDRPCLQRRPRIGTSCSSTSFLTKPLTNKWVTNNHPKTGTNSILKPQPYTLALTLTPIFTLLVYSNPSPKS